MLSRRELLRSAIGDYYTVAVADLERLDARRTGLAFATDEIFPLSPIRPVDPQEVDEAFFSAPHVAARLDRLLAVEYQGLLRQERRYSGSMNPILEGIMEEARTLLASLREYRATL